MDQDHVQYEAGYTPFRVKKTAADFRATARTALKPAYWTMFGASLLAGLLGGAASSASTSISSGSTEIKVSGGQLEHWIELFREGGLMAVLNSNPMIMFIFVGALTGAVFGVLLSLFVGAPVTLGYQKLNLDLIDGKPVRVSAIFDYFGKCYRKSVALRFVHDLIVTLIMLPLSALTLTLLWLNRGVVLNVVLSRASTEDIVTFGLIALVLSVVSILTALAQIVVQYRYVFCFMILAEYPEMGVMDALRNSASLMKGNKWRFFCLNISFIGWILLAAFCTCGLGMLFLTPYIDASAAAFYDEIANRAAARETEFPSLDPDDYTVD